MVKKLLSISVIILITLLATYKSFSFYFFEDDFTIFYTVKNNICPFQWPHNSYCPIFNTLYKFFGYEPKFYFGMGITLAITSTLAFYLFAKEIYGQKKGYLLALVLSSGYFGAANLLYVYSSITTYLSLLLLFLTLYFLLKYTKGKEVFNFFYGLLFFTATLLIFPLRASLYILPTTALMYIFWGKNKLKANFIIPILLLFLVFTVCYFLIPGIKTANYFSVWSKAGQPNINFLLIFSLAKNYFSTISSFLLTDFMKAKISAFRYIKNIETIRIILGMLANLFVILFFFKNKSVKNTLKIGLFSLVWIISQYLPIGFVTGWGLDSTDRYIIFPYIGIVLLLGLFAKRNSRKWYIFVFILIAMNLIQSNLYLSEFKGKSIKRKYFYQELKKQIPNITSRTLFYFDAPSPELKRELGDFMSAATYGYEATFATEFGGVTKEEIKVIHNSEAFWEVSLKDIEIDKFFTFFYDGKKLINTTEETRSLLGEMQIARLLPLSNRIDTVYTQDPDAKMYTGENNTIHFSSKNFSPILPSKIYLEIVAFIPNFPVPYTQNCFECSYRPHLIRDSLVNEAAFEEIRENPAAMIKTNEDKENLIKVLNTKAHACIKWRSGEFEGRIPFYIEANGKLKTYELNFPTLGPKEISLSLECINYPINLTLHSATTRSPILSFGRP